MHFYIFAVQFSGDTKYDLATAMIALQALAEIFYTIQQFQTLCLGFLTYLDCVFVMYD